MSVEAVGVGDIGDENPVGQLAYKTKLAAAIAHRLNFSASLVAITVFEATALGADDDDLYGRRHLQQAVDWSVDFHFVLKSPNAAKMLNAIDAQLNGSMAMDLVIDGAAATASFPVKYATVGGEVVLAQQSVYDVMEMKCPLITYLHPVSNDCIRCKPGKMVNSDQTGCLACELFVGQYSVSGEPCQMCLGGSEPNLDRTGCNGCPQNYFSGDGIKCIRCPAFQVTRLLPMQTSSDACVCEENMYDIDFQSPELSCYKYNGDLLAEAPDVGAGPCKRCPVDRSGLLHQCLGCDHNENSTALLKPGYWRSAPDSARIFQCEFGQAACLGGAYNSACGSGYTGILCASCADDFYKKPTKCETCPGTAFVQLCISLVAVGVFCLFLINRNNASVRAPTIKHAMQSGATGSETFVTSIRVLVSFFTVQSISGELRNEWPDQLATMFHWESAFSEISSLVGFSRCVLSWDPFFKYEFIMQKAIVISLLPIAASAGVLALYALPHLLRYLGKRCCDVIKRRAHVEAYKVTGGYTGVQRGLLGAYADDVISAIVVLVYLLHPSVMRQAFAMLSCQLLPDVPQSMSLLKADMGVVCDSTEHSSVQLYVTMPAGLFCILLPLFAVYRLRKHKKEDRLRDARIQRRWGWLIRGYEPDYYYWELFVTLRKMGMAFVSVFLTDLGPQIQTCACLLVVQLGLVMNVSRGPFVYDNQDSLETLCLTVNFVTLLSGLFYMNVADGYTGVKPDGPEQSFVTNGTLVLNILVGAYILGIFTLRLWREHLSTRRKPPLPGQDPDDLAALAKNHLADLVQRFLTKARALEDTALTLGSVQHQLQHAKLLLPELGPDVDGLLRSTARLNAKVTDTRVRILEVQRTRRNQLMPAKEAVTAAFQRLNLLALPSSRPAGTPPGDNPSEPRALEDAGPPAPPHVTHSLKALGMSPTRMNQIAPLPALPPLPDPPQLPQTPDGTMDRAAASIPSPATPRR
jgi:hypothetical protein